jgi:hypothetical protein
MRAVLLALALFVAIAPSTSNAHGPQIQITNDNNKIITRRLLLDGPYSNSLTSPKSVYVMPLSASDSVWYSRPNNDIDPITLLPAFPSGPGLAYGYDLADGGAQEFAVGSIISVAFTDGLKLWNGASFVDAGATELKAFRGSNPNITTPVANFAITSDSGPFDSLSLAPVAAGYGAEGAEVHGTFRFALLGDGSSPTSASPDGVYLVSLQLSSTQAGITPSDPYYFVLHKNASPTAISSAVESLGFSSSAIQYVPEPSVAVLLTAGSGYLLALRRGKRRREDKQQ